MPSTGTPLDRVVFARGVIAASGRHVVVAGLLVSGLATVAALSGASAPVILVPLGLGASLVLYNLLRIRAAKRSLQSPEAGAELMRQQRRSHLVRGTFYLVASPILLLGVALGLASERPAPPLAAWLLFAAIATVLGVGCLWWLRALRRVRAW